MACSIKYNPSKSSICDWDFPWNETIQQALGVPPFSALETAGNPHVTRDHQYGVWTDESDDETDEQEGRPCDWLAISWFDKKVTMSFIHNILYHIITKWGFP